MTIVVLKCSDDTVKCVLSSLHSIVTVCKISFPEKQTGLFWSGGEKVVVGKAVRPKLLPAARELEMLILLDMTSSELCYKKQREERDMTVS